MSDGQVKPSIHSRGHEMFHDDMIMYVIINDQQSFMATINISSPWSTLIIAMNRWEFMHIWTMIIHTCMNSHLFIAMINVDHTDDVLIVAMKDNWSCMKILFIASYHEPYMIVIMLLLLTIMVMMDSQHYHKEYDDIIMIMTPTWQIGGAGGKFGKSDIRGFFNLWSHDVRWYLQTFNSQDIFFIKHRRFTRFTFGIIFLIAFISLMLNPIMIWF